MEILEGKKDKEISEEKIDENTDVDVKNLENSEENQPQEESEKSEEIEKPVENKTENNSENEDENKRFIDLSKDDE